MVRRLLERFNDVTERLCMGKNLVMQYKSYNQYNMDGRGFAGGSSANVIQLRFSYAVIQRISTFVFASVYMECDILA